MKDKQEQKELLVKLHEQSKDKSISELAHHKMQAEVKSQVEQKKTREVTLHSERKINFEDIDSIKDVVHARYHARTYQHFSDDTHSSTTTVYFNLNSQKYELLTKAIALKQLVELLKTTQSEFYCASQLINKHLSKGSAYGDIYRSAFDVLSALKIVKLDVAYKEETKRRRYSLIDSAKLATVKL